MADVKWIKIYTDMVSNKKIKRIRTLPEGNNIVLIWVFLLSQAGECNKNGALYLTDTLPFRSEDLAIEFDYDVTVINLALITLERFSMIEVFDEIIFIKNWEEYQNIDGMDKIREQTRLRNIKYRENKRLLLLNDATVTSHDETELELELDLELEKEKDKKRGGGKHSPQNVFGTYQREIGPLSEIIAEKLIDLELTYSEEWVKQAIKAAVVQDIKKMSYIEGTLKRWKATGHAEPWTIAKQQEPINNNLRHINRGSTGTSGKHQANKGGFMKHSHGHKNIYQTESATPDPLLDNLKITLTEEQDFYLRSHLNEKRSVLAKKLQIPKLKLNHYIYSLSPMSEETRAKISQALKGNKNCRYSKKVG
jgi:predicted phage replisome organizer